MPLYEYKCDQCETVSEFHMKMSDPHPTACPKCGASSLRKLMSQTAFLLKGDGWYADGYSGPSNKKTEKSNQASETESPAASTPKDGGTDSSSSSKAKDTKGSTSSSESSGGKSSAST